MPLRVFILSDHRFHAKSGASCFDWGCMPAAFSRAIQALTLNPDCMSLFGTDQTRAAGFNPETVLSNIVYGSHSFGTVKFSLHKKKWGVAETRPAGILPIPGLASKVKITINELSGYSFWNNGDATENAETLYMNLRTCSTILAGLEVLSCQIRQRTKAIPML